MEVLLDALCRLDETVRAIERTFILAPRHPWHRIPEDVSGLNTYLIKSAGEAFYDRYGL
jgi:hypothetical protein